MTDKIAAFIAAQRAIAAQRGGTPSPREPDNETAAPPFSIKLSPEQIRDRERADREEFLKQTSSTSTSRAPGKRPMKKPKPTPAPADNEAASFIASVAMPAPPYIVRDESTKLGTVNITEAGLEFIKRRAEDGASQNLIAAEMGLTKTTLQKLFQRDERCRVAWEHGVALEEMELVDILKQAARKGYAVAALFLLKTRHGYQESAPPPATAPNVTIVLPDAYSPADYLRIVNERPKVTRPVLAALPSGKTQEVTR